MNNINIEKYAKTSEFRATLDFNKKGVDWNVINKQIRSGCHCIWVKSDLQSYVTIYGLEEKCVRDMLNVLETCLSTRKKLPNRNSKVSMTEIRTENF